MCGNTVLFPDLLLGERALLCVLLLAAGSWQPLTGLITESRVGGEDVGSRSIPMQFRHKQRSFKNSEIQMVVLQFRFFRLVAWESFFMFR